jgi:Mg-chelatase subunit ChlI
MAAEQEAVEVQGRAAKAREVLKEVARRVLRWRGALEVETKDVAEVKEATEREEREEKEEKKEQGQKKEVETTENDGDGDGDGDGGGGGDNGGVLTDLNRLQLLVTGVLAALARHEGVSEGVTLKLAETSESLACTEAELRLCRRALEDLRGKNTYFIIHTVYYRKAGN